MDDQTASIDIREYLRILVKRRYQLIAVAAAIIAAATIASYLVPKVYEATTTVSIGKNYLNVLMSDMAVDAPMGDRMEALSVIMTGRSMLLQVLAGLGKNVTSKTDAEIEKIIKHFQKSTQIRFEAGRSGRSNMEIFTVTYRDRDPRFARDYVNALVDAYVALSVARTREDALGANKFLYEQLELYKRKIDDAEAALEKRRKQPGALAEAKLLSLRKKYQDLLVQYTDRHPEAVRLRAEIAAAEEEMQKERPGGAVAGAAGERSMADLERDRDAYRRIYDSLVASLGRSEVSAKLESRTQDDTFTVLEPAVLPTQPVSKPRWKLLFLGLLAGIAGGSAAVIVLDRTDRTIKNAAPLKALGLPVVALVPRIEHSEAIAAARRKDLLVYGAAGIYGAGIIALMVVEYLS